VVRIGTKLRAILRRDRVEAEMQEEMSAHLDLAIERLMARGMSEVEARRTALREFGNVPSLQEEARDARGARWVESLIADTRFAFRTFRKTPLATATIVLILALGLGTSTALVTYAHSVLTLPAPGIPRDKSLVRVRPIESRFFPRMGEREGLRPISYPEFREYAGRTDLFAEMAAWSQANVLLETGEDSSVQLNARAHLVTDGYFPLLGVSLILGPGLPDSGPEMNEPTAATLSVVISHAIWDAYFDRSSDVIGSTVRVSDLPATVVGVAPPRFLGVNAPGVNPTIWLPLSVLPALQKGSTSVFASYDSTFIRGAIARLHPDVTMDIASREASVIAARILERATQQSEGTGATHSVKVVPFRGVNESPTSEEMATTALFAFAILTLLILAVICTNVAALLATAALGRRQEIALRLALGAARDRVVRQLLTESILRAILGGGLGVLILWFLIRTFGGYISNALVLFNPVIILLTFGIALGTGILLGLLPALHATRTSIADDLKGSGPAVTGSRSRLPRAFVVAQVTVTQPILLGLATLLMILSTGWIEFRPRDINDHLLDVNLGSEFVTLPIEEREPLSNRLMERIREVPGVIGVIPHSSAISVPTSGLFVHPDDRIKGVTPTGPLWIKSQRVATGFFELMNMPILLGDASLTGTESATDHSTRVVIGSERAHKLWGSANPIGRRIVSEDGWERVVVAVADESAAAFRAVAIDGSNPIYVVSTSPLPFPSFFVRTVPRAESVIPEIRSIVRDITPGTGEPGFQTLAEAQRSFSATFAQMTVAAIAGGGLALLLSGLGLFSVVATTVKRRAKEVGIRTVMGASPKEVVRIFIWDGVRMGGLGLLIGLPLSLLFLRILLANEIGGGASALAIGAGGCTALIVIAVTLLASWLPARRAVAVDPMTVLRVE